MKEFITVSSKGQIVIPKKMREKANLQSGDQLIAEWDGKQLQLRKVEQKSTKVNPSVVRELLGKYSTDEQENGSEKITTREYRENLYGKINDGQ